MSNQSDGASRRERTYIYWVAAGLLVVMAAIALISYRGAKESQAASAKADELLAVFQKAGVRELPSKDQIVGVLGDDGGSVCQDPSNSLRKATLFSMIANGAAGPGMRPVITDSRLVRGQLAVIGVYCPDELPDVQAFVDDLKTDSVVKG